MDIDKTTLNDLSVFHHEEEFSLFHKLNFTQTTAGRNWLMHMFAAPFNSIQKIKEVQDIIQAILYKLPKWPVNISNGTVMVMEKYYETVIDTFPGKATLLNGYTYKILHAPDYSLTRYSITHFADFIKGINNVVEIFKEVPAPPTFKTYLQRCAAILDDGIIKQLIQTKKEEKLTPQQTVLFGNHLRYRYKNNVLELLDIYGRFDAWYSMAFAMQKFNLSFPQFKQQHTPLLQAQQLYHILLPQPVAYNVGLNNQSNFIFLTGANMAGKSTFIKSVGAAVYLAHLGMGVPAKSMQLSLFDGILSNINVTDNIVKGESYFFNEVQRIKNTIIKINNGKKWLVLIDELFKGTNVQDAMKCSSTVIKGLIRIKDSLFILSTHLYEIGEELKHYPNIIFRYFETHVHDDQLEFSYQMKEGISNDRLGYLILKREKVVEMLEGL
jgi:DNA mismatch repair protein MutS